MLLRYRAIDQHGRQVRGRMEANNPDDLEARLARQGLELVDARPEAVRTRLFRASPVRRQDLITFCFHMEQMTRAGVPLLDSLADLRDTLDQGAFRDVVARVIEDIEGGLQFSQALARHPQVFEVVFTSLIAAGEETGRLPDVLKNLVETLKWQDELAAQTKKIIMYPAFVGTVIMAVVVFLMVYLVPQLVKFIQSMQRELPWNTKMLIAISNFFVHEWYVLVATPFVLAALWWLWKRSDPLYHHRVDRLKLKLPLIGPVLHKIVLARFANYFALMYDAGIAILDSLKTLEGVVGNRVIAEALTDVRETIAQGQSVTASFEAVRLFPPLVLRMLRVGEQTGALDSALQNVAYFYNRDVREAIEKVQALVEPVMTVVLGLILGSVMLSVLGPIYDLISQVKA
jgi:type IV pilus assembly protein PilC